MAALWNKRRERFCQLIAAGLARDVGAAGLTQHAAYQAAGYAAQGASARVCAHRLLTQANEVVRRIKELQKQHATRKAVTVDSIATELDEARTLAIETKQASAMIAASGTKAKLYGLFIDRVEQGKAGDFSKAESSSDLADMMLKQACPDIGQITDEQRAMAIDAGARYAAELAAIGSGSVQASPDPRSQPRLAGMRPRPLRPKQIMASH